uniref:Reticulon-like protein n=4 Tax=Schistocephalus solidus TaxID=70667 RepID=A0A0X3NJN2_SCHSO
MGTVIDEATGLPVTDMDKILSVMDNPPSFQSDSSVYGSSSLEFIIPPSKPPMRVAEVVSERNVRPSELPTEMDLRAVAASRRLNLPDVSPILLDLIYWRRPYISAIVFITAMVLELGLLMYSVISVISNFLLALLFMAVGTRLYFRIINAPEASPLNALGKLNCRLSPTVSAELVQVLTARLNYGMVMVRDLFLLRSLSDSMKFGAVLYSLTYIGARFNFLTLCILGTLVAFSIPKVCEVYKTEINCALRTLVDEGNKLLDRLGTRIRRLLPGANHLKLR